jgi:hypothetical protein
MGGSCSAWRVRIKSIRGRKSVARSLLPFGVKVEAADDTVDLLEVLRTGAVRGSFHWPLVRGSSWMTKSCGWRSVLLGWLNSDVC